VEIGAVSFFDYKNYDPNDTRFHTRLEYADHFRPEDFVSSVYLFRKSSLAQKGWDHDDGFHQKLRALAVTKPDMVENVGFGVAKSVYVSMLVVQKTIPERLRLILAL